MRESIQGLETLGEVIGVEECVDVLAKLVSRARARRGVQKCSSISMKIKSILCLGRDQTPCHADHIHVDLAERAHGYRMCQWDVREPEAVTEVPIPLPKPVMDRDRKDGKAKEKPGKSRVRAAKGKGARTPI